MHVTGFTFIRNAIKYDYPIVEAIRSILPICDDFVVAVGQCEDATLALIQSIDPSKIRIIETVWDDTLREGGAVLAQETNKALAEIKKATWAFYIQGDEVVHEQDLPTLKAAMERYADDTRIDGLLLKYRHFYGSYDYIGSSSNWYPVEIRILRPNIQAYSYKDAQGFRKGNNEKLRVKELDAYVHHYGWVKEPTAMQRKQEDFNKLWHDDAWVAQNVKPAIEFDYSENLSALAKYTGTHPAVMQARITQKNWQFTHDASFTKWTWKEKFKRFMLSYFGVRIGYKNYVKK